MKVWDLATVQGYMGHSDISTTMGYVHHVPKTEHADQLGRLVAGVSEPLRDRLPAVSTVDATEAD